MRGFAARRIVAHRAGAAGLAAVLLACSGRSAGAPSATCTNEGNVSCPAADGGAPPSYQTDVEPILASRCYGCHGPGGIEVSSINLTTYHGVVTNDVVGQLSECFMPPPDAGQPTPAERQTLFEWIACGEPNN